MSIKFIWLILFRIVKASTLVFKIWQGSLNKKIKCYFKFHVLIFDILVGLWKDKIFPRNSNISLSLFRQSYATCLKSFVFCDAIWKWYLWEYILCFGPMLRIFIYSGYIDCFSIWRKTFVQLLSWCHESAWRFLLNPCCCYYVYAIGLLSNNLCR